MNYIVKSRTSGGRYLVTRESGRKAYRWAKRARTNAYRFPTYDAARNASVRYNGELSSIQ